MENLTELQMLLTKALKAMNLDAAAILFIMLALKNESAQGAMLLFIKDNYKTATQDEFMQAAVDYQEIAEEMGLE